MKEPHREFYRPIGPEVKSKLDRFRQMNDWVTARGGWVISPPGDDEMTIECLPGSTLPDDLRDTGYDVQADGEGERILPSAIVQRFACNVDGDFELLTEGSTRPVALTQTHAGVTKIQRYSFKFADRDQQ